MTSERAGCKRPYDELAASAAAAAVATAASEGLPFVRSDNSSGFKGVALATCNKSKPFVVLKAGSERQYLGYFLTAEEAALAYSRHIGKAAALAMQEEASKEDYCLMSAAEVEQAAAQEGLWLLEDQTSSTGYRGVAFLSDCPRRPYAVRSQRVEIDGGKNRQSWLGYFTTKQEAALAYARHLGRGWFQAELAKAVKAVEAAEAITAAKAVRAKAKAAKAEAITAAKVVRAKAKAAEAAEAARPEVMAAKAVKRIESKAACKREEKARFKAWAQEQQKQVQERQREMLRKAGEEQKRLFREAAERLQQQHQQQQHAAAPTAAASGDVGISATMTIDELVMHVLGNAHCPHRCLDVELGAPRETAQKQYLALVLRLHPDKTGHPRAKEAFAAVEKSYQAFR